MSGEAWQRFLEAWRARCGLRPLDHPIFSGVGRVWRVEMHPAFHDDVAVTVTEMSSGGFIELRALGREAHAWATLDAGGQAQPAGPAPAPRVWEAPVTTEQVEALAARMPRLPLHSLPIGIDGMIVLHEALLDGAPLRFWSWSPTLARAPLHREYVVALCELAASALREPAAQAALHPLAAYLR